MANDLSNKPQLDQLPYGARGHVLIDDTAEYTGPFFLLVVLEEAEIDTITFAAGQLDSSGGSYDGMILPMGATIYGTMESIKLTSGVVQAYKL